MFHLRAPLLPFVGPKADTQVGAGFLFVLILKRYKSIHANSLPCCSAWNPASSDEATLSLSWQVGPGALWVWDGVSVVKLPRGWTDRFPFPTLSFLTWDFQAGLSLSLNNSTPTQEEEGMESIGEPSLPGNLRGRFGVAITKQNQMFSLWFPSTSLCFASFSFPHCVASGSPSSVCESLSLNSCVREILLCRYKHKNLISNAWYQFQIISEVATSRNYLEMSENNFSPV